MLEKIRKSKHLTQKELAIKSGVSLPTIGRVERGENQPSGATARRIASALEIDWTNLFANVSRNSSVISNSTTVKEAAAWQSTRKKTCEKPAKRKA